MRIWFILLVSGVSLCGTAWGGWEPVSKLKAPDPCEEAVFGFSISIDNNTAVVGAPWNQGAVHIYEYDGLSWDYVKTLLPPVLSDTDWFGYSVSIDSNVIVVGTYRAEEVYVYDYNGTQWSSNPEILSVAGSQNYFGFSVAIDGNTIVVGAEGSISQTGAAYVFDYNGVSWAYSQTLTNPGGDNGDQFGRAVCIDADVIVVGSDEQFEVGAGDPNYRRGSVCVFRQSGGSWSLEQKILAPNTSSNDLFGYSVSVSGDTFVAGSYKHNYGANAIAGAALVYKCNGSSWVKEATLYSPNADISYAFGNSVAIDGNSLLVGEMYHDGAASNSGAAFLFKRTCGSWSQGQKCQDPLGAVNDYFGRSVEIDGQTAIAGAYRDDQGQTDSGAAYIFLLLAADINRDGLVSSRDYAILAGQWFQEPDEPSADIAPLYCGDNIVNGLDLRVLTQQWLRIGSAYIPSP
jgi:hypothetical protein